MKTAYYILTFTLLSFFSAPHSVAQDAKVHDLIGELAKKGFNTLLAAISKTDLPEKLSTGSFTLLAPTDNAFRDIPKAQLDALLADKAALTTVLSNHIIEGKFSAAELKSAKPKTLTGTALEVKSVEGKLKVNGATIVKPDVSASNGVIQGIDKVLLR